jgi:hypothetical protein
MRPARITLSAMALAFATGAASAAIVTFSGIDAGAGEADPRPNANAAAAAFDAAGNETIFNFEAQPLGLFTNLALGSSVTMSSTDAFIANLSGGSPERLFGYNTTSGGSQYVLLSSGGSVTFTFATPIEDFGAYFTGVQLSDNVIAFNDGAPQSLAIPSPGANSGGVVFFGFTDFGSAISSLTVTFPTDIVGFDDVRFSFVAAAVPEPGTAALLGIAIAGLAGVRGRRARAGGR